MLERPFYTLDDLLRRLDRHVREIDAADHDLLAAQLFEHCGVQVRLRGLDRNLLAGAAGELGKEGIARGPRVDDRRVAEADMHGSGSPDALERAVQRLQPVFARLLGARLHVRLVDLHDFCACCDMVKGPGTVIFVFLEVFFLRNSRSSTSTGCLRRILPTMRGTGLGWPERSSAVPGWSISMPSSAVAKRLE